ncbi:hypothetical protein [Streptomyces sp. NPDC057413]
MLIGRHLTPFSPTVSGSAYALLPAADINWYPFRTLGLISVPATL